MEIIISALYHWLNNKNTRVDPDTLETIKIVFFVMVFATTIFSFLFVKWVKVQSLDIFLIALLYTFLFGIVGHSLKGLLGVILSGFFGFFFGMGLITLPAIITTYPHTLPIWLGILIVIGTTELLFYLDNTKPRLNENKIWFTCKRKGEALFEALLILVNLNNIRYLLVTYPLDFKQYLFEITKWIGYIAIGVACLTIIIGLSYGYIYINSMKYNKR